MISIENELIEIIETSKEVKEINECFNLDIVDSKFVKDVRNSNDKSEYNWGFSYIDIEGNLEFLLNNGSIFIYKKRSSKIDRCIYVFSNYRIIYINKYIFIGYADSGKFDKYIKDKKIINKITGLLHSYMWHLVVSNDEETN